MTINQLIKKLQKLEKECPRNTQVSVDWKEIQDDDYTYVPVHQLSVEYCNMVDENGLMMYRKDGQEVMMHCLVLK
jgi:hypothetical protein